MAQENVTLKPGEVGGPSFNVEKESHAERNVTDRRLSAEVRSNGELEVFVEKAERGRGAENWWASIDLDPEEARELCNFLMEHYYGVSAG